MTVSNHLYRLSEYSRVAAVQEVGGEREYEGRWIAAGPDAAIEIMDNVITGFIRGEPCHTSGQL